MASYFYLMSSLPMLKAEGEPPIKYEKFLSYCSESVSENKYELLKNLTVESQNGPLVSEWAVFYKNYKAELTFQRSKKQGTVLNEDYLKDIETERVVLSALADKNPYNAEITLLSFLFSKLDFLIGTHTFDDYALFGYALKLKLLERKAVFSKEKGRAEFDRLVKGLEKQIENIH